MMDVVDFDTLYTYVKREVEQRVLEMGERQVPAAFKATAFGEGQVIFLLPAE
jgi:hypothetical protein